MSDLALRKLERRAKETGAIEDAAAWLRERVRLGLASAGKLSLAAYCRSPVARLAVPPDSTLTGGVLIVAQCGSPWWTASDDWALGDWIWGLGRWGRAVLVRAGEIRRGQ